jgi:hypothetical protein
MTHVVISLRGQLDILIQCQALRHDILSTEAHIEAHGTDTAVSCDDTRS